jgi:DHA1 family multidrug resistance protein B-like MFS transporter
MLARSYLTPLRDRSFLRVALAMTVILGLEMQRANGFIGVHIADQRRQTLISAGHVHVSVTGVELLGVVQATNTVAIVIAAMFVERVLRTMRDTWRINVGIGVFAGCCVVLATAGAAWVLIAAVLLLTAGELMHIPAMQAVLARVVPDDARAGYMAVFNLNERGGAMIAALSLTVAPVLGTAGLCLMYGLLGAAAIYLYAPLVRSPAPRPVYRGRLAERSTPDAG